MKQILKNIINLMKGEKWYPASKRIIKLALTNFWRNKFLSFATITVIALILFSFNIILNINLSSQSIINELNKKVDIILYLKDDSDLIQVDAFVKELLSLKEITKVIYTSKEEALKNFQDTYALGEDIFQKYGLENKLPANIQIITSSSFDHEIIMSYIQNSQFSDLLENIESDKESQEIAQKLNEITKITKKIMWGIVFAFIIGGILIILNSISLNMYSRKEEIHIMRLVGANYHFIRFPFIIEGAMYGLLAVTLSIILLIIFLKSVWILPKELPNFMDNTGLLKTFTLESIIGILIGIISSQIAIHRYFTGKIT